MQAWRMASISAKTVRSLQSGHSGVLLVLVAARSWLCPALQIRLARPGEVASAATMAASRVVGSQVSAPLECRWRAFIGVAHVLHILCICQEWGCPVSPRACAGISQQCETTAGGNCERWR